MLWKLFSIALIGAVAWWFFARGALSRPKEPSMRRAVELVPCPRCGAYAEIGGRCDCSRGRER